MRVLGRWVDFVNLRSEEYSGDSRIPTVAFGTPLQDAERRDFTVNAMFYNVNLGVVEDFTGHGRSDLAARLLRTPLPAHVTFLDDPLRLLRGVRFAARLGFALHEDVLASATPAFLGALTGKVSRERIGNELDGMLVGCAPDVAFSLLYRLRVLPHIFPLPPLPPGEGAEAPAGDPAFWAAGVRYAVSFCRLWRGLAEGAAVAAAAAASPAAQLAQGAGSGSGLKQPTLAAAVAAAYAVSGAAAQAAPPGAEGDGARAAGHAAKRLRASEDGAAPGAPTAAAAPPAAPAAAARAPDAEEPSSAGGSGSADAVPADTAARRLQILALLLLPVSDRLYVSGAHGERLGKGGVPVGPPLQRTSSVREFIIKVALKRKGRDSDDVGVLLASLPGFSELLRDEAAGCCPDKSSPAWRLRVARLLRASRAAWPLCLQAACSVAIADAAAAAAPAAADDPCAGAGGACVLTPTGAPPPTLHTLAAADAIVAAVDAQGLSGVWLAKPLLTGKALFAATGVTPGPAVSAMMEEQAHWMVLHPAGDAQALTAHLVQWAAAEGGKRGEAKSGAAAAPPSHTA